MVRSLLRQLRIIRAARACLKPLLPSYNLRTLQNYARYWNDFKAYGQLQGGRQPCSLEDVDIQINDWHATTPLGYYFYQDTWAFHKVAQARPSLHVDIGSTALLVGCFAAVAPTISLDIRPVVANVKGLTPLAGLITTLPFQSNSVASLSSLCVLEHIGLGRYGDPLDTEGTRKAAAELERVIKPGGSLYVSVPVGRSYVAFNAHRSFNKQDVLRMFPQCRLADYTVVNNSGEWGKEEADPALGLHVGLFHLTK